MDDIERFVALVDRGSKYPFLFTLRCQTCLCPLWDAQDLPAELAARARHRGWAILGGRLYCHACARERE